MLIWKRASQSDRRLFVISVICLAGSISALGIHQHRVEAKSGDEQFYRFMDVAAEVYSQIRSRYVEEIDSQELLEASLRGMVQPLDEHSQYMPPAVLEDLEKETGKEYGGIGIHITLRQGILTVIAPMPGSPAARAGIQPWDRFTEIGGKSTQGMEVRDAVDILMGPPNTKVKFKIWREGLQEPIEYELTRANIRVESVNYKMLPGSIGYVRLSKFAENSTADIRRALLDLRGQGMKGLILDLRFNTGGLLKEAIDISNLFVDKGDLIVSTKGRLRAQNRDYTAQSNALIRVPTFVLVNSGSASASEIVAGALQDHHAALIIGPAGQNTFGKGSVQTIESLSTSLEEDKEGNPRQSALRLTTARYYTPSGRTIHQLGVTPDIGVPIPSGHEAQLLEHGLLGDPPNPQLLADEPEGAPADPNTPFFKRGSKPKFRAEKPDDIILQEAQKIMQMYMTMQPSAADDASKDAVAEAKPKS